MSNSRNNYNFYLLCWRLEIAVYFLHYTHTAQKTACLTANPLNPGKIYTVLLINRTRTLFPHFYIIILRQVLLKIFDIQDNDCIVWTTEYIGIVSELVWLVSSAALPLQWDEWIWNTHLYDNHGCYCSLEHQTDLFSCSTGA